MFEWAWQNPNATLRLKHLNLKKIPRKETEFKFKLRVLSEMLRVGPWCRLPLTIRWLEDEYKEDFPLERIPPKHMTICQGAVKSRNLKPKIFSPAHKNEECLLCSNYILQGQSKLTCINPSCELLTHITCLADIFLTSGEYVPIEGTCPFCCIKLKWGDLIRKMKGCLSSKGEELSQDEKYSSGDEEVQDYDEKVTQKEFEYTSWFDDCKDEELSQDEKLSQDDKLSQGKKHSSCDNTVQDTKEKVLQKEFEYPSWFDDCNEEL